MLKSQAMSQKPISDVKPDAAGVKTESTAAGVKHPPIRSYGRRRTKGLRNTRADAMDSVLPKLQITLPPISSSPRKRGSQEAGREIPAFAGMTETGGDIDPHSFFDTKVKEVWFEIGFGNGEHILHQALNNPEVGLIGCEPFMNGVAALCVGIDKQKVKNIRLWPDDGRLFLLHPDPWPKSRHHKRRFIQTESLTEIARLLKPGAEFRMATDHADLATWLLDKTYHHPDFTWTATAANDWRIPPADWPETRYGQKGVKQGRPPVYFIFKRK
jgi:tRNA (guanine-N7-)-methyltransferase